MNPAPMRRLVATVFAVALALAAVAVYYFYDPSTAGFFPRCPFLVLTGYECPGCGSQRALHDLLAGDVASAFAHNALMVASLPVVAVYLSAEALRRRCQRFYAAVNSKAVIYVILAVVVAWWVLRNII